MELSESCPNQSTNENVANESNNQKIFVDVTVRSDESSKAVRFGHHTKATKKETALPIGMGNAVILQTNK